MASLRKSLVVALALGIALSSLALIARPVAAAQNRPTWTQGDFWVYSRTEGTSTSTVRLDVLEKTTLTLTLGTYEVWHVTITTTPSGGSATVQHSWVRDSDLGIAKANFTVGTDVQVTFEPPLVLAQFPLTVNAQWSLSTTVRVVDTGFSFSLPYSATVTAEQSTTVTAGTFNVAVVRSPSTGTARDENHYSESAGNSVRQESYDNDGDRVAEEQLTSYRYQSGSLFLILLLVAVLVIAAVAVGVFVTLRRRRRGAPPGMPPPPPPTGP
jgi:hypothetical protein